MRSEAKTKAITLTVITETTVNFDSRFVKQGSGSLAARFSTPAGQGANVGGMEEIMGEVIVITSGKGGVGKTTSAANLGTALTMMGKKVALVDTDIGLRNLDVVMGLENRIVYDIVDVVEENCKLKQALIKDRRYEGLFLLPAAQTRDKNSVNEEQMKKICEDLKLEFDYIIIDCPAGIEQGFKNAIAGADRALVVTTPEVSAVRDADRIVGLSEKGKEALENEDYTKVVSFYRNNKD